MTLLELTARVLRDPGALIDESSSPEALRTLAPKLLAITFAGAAVFGGVIGLYRGGIQIAFAALKMPFILLIPVLVTLPAIRALHQSGGIEVSRGRIGMAALTGIARTAVLAAALAPILWLWWSVAPSYHDAVLTTAVALGLAGLPGLTTVARAVPGGGRRRVFATLGTVLLLGAVTAQTGWVLRPFIARPTAEVTLLRGMEEDVFSSLAATRRSANGVYTGWDAKSEGLLGRDKGE